MKKFNAVSIFICILSMCLHSEIMAEQPAYLTNLSNGFGPFDYTNPATWKHIDVVEKYHFDEGVKTFRRGLNGSVWSDITYTLRAFPNHHPALDAMSRLLEQKDSAMSYEKRSKLFYLMPKSVTADAYFEKAIKFAPTDPMTHLLFGIHLHKQKKYKSALKQYKAAENLGLLSADLFYNLGLVYIELGETDNALKSAKKAYGLGHPLMGLKKKLTKLGAWKK